MSDRRGPNPFDSNEYLRPNDEWVCGGAPDGAPCTRGPSSKGECGAACEPYLIGDRYYCDNAALLSGRCDDGPTDTGECCHTPALCEPAKFGGSYVCRLGACTDGPMPDGACPRSDLTCQPGRTIKSQRKLIVASAVSAAAGFCLLVLFLPGMESVASPGPVASVHNAISRDCGACHIGGESVLPISSGAFASAERQTALCLECHVGLAEFSDSPHTLNPEALPKPGEPSASSPVALGAARAVFGGPHDLACSTCHHEHHGSDAELTAIADQQCQACHTNTFGAFASSHPEFENYPLRRRSEVYFDHSTHYGLHFSNYKRTMGEGLIVGGEDDLRTASADTCAVCHKLDDSGAYMVTKGYEMMCSACHDSQIWDGRTPALGALATTAVSGEPSQPIEIPGRASAFSAPPILQVLLAADESYAEAFSSLREIGWGPEAPRTDEQQQAIETTERAVQALLGELQGDARGALERRLDAAFGDLLSRQQVSRLARVTATAPFLSLSRRLSDEANGPATDSTGGAADLLGGDTGWHLREPGELLAYRPQEHADSLLKAWTDAAATLASAAGETEEGDSSTSAKRAAAESLSELLLNPTAAGRCVKCHTVDETPAGELLVNWRAVSRSASAEGLTRFRHAPHIVFLSGKDRCATCHELQDLGQVFRPEFVSKGHSVRDATQAACSGFSQVSGVAACAQCHNASGASQSCTTCHRYHAVR